MGLYVLSKDRKSATKIIFFFLCFFSSGWVGGYALISLGLGPEITGYAARAIILFTIPFPYILLLFSRSFPKERMAIAPVQAILFSLPSLLFLLLLPNRLFIETSVTSDNLVKALLGPLHYMYFTYFFIYFFIAAVNMTLNYRQSSPIDQMRYKYFIGGLLLTLITVITFNQVFVFLGIHSFMYFGPLSILILVTATTYSILKYRLMDITFALKKTTAYSFVTTGITITYVLVVVLFESIFRSFFSYNSFGAAVPAILIIAVTFIPLRERLQMAADKIFFRRKFEYQAAIKEVSRLSIAGADLRAILRFVDYNIFNGLGVIKHDLMLINTETVKKYVSIKKAV